MDITATAKNIRVSPQKVRLVVNQIKKMAPTEAVQILDYLPQKSSLLLKKVISSAIANAKNNYGIAEDVLKFKEIQVGKGPMFKRYRAVARGRAHSILKRTSHVTVVVTGEKNAPKNEATTKNNKLAVLDGKGVVTPQKAAKEREETKNGSKS
jgi:large subunit ribosomal protein L22